MSGQRNLLVGLDLCNDYTQISCYNVNTYEPETIKFDYDSENELLDTAMAVTKDTKEWLLSEDAISAVKEDKAILVNNIVEMVRKNRTITLFDTVFTAHEVLVKFLRKSLSLIKRYHPSDSINKLVVTVDKTDIELVQGIFKALEEIGIEKERISVQDHARSFMYYVMSQKKELWMNDVCLFNYSIKGLTYYQISIDRKRRPITVGVTKKDYTDAMSYMTLKEASDESIKEIFEGIVDKSMYKQIISTVYLTGKGMSGDWIHNSLDTFGNGKRIFMGINLFSEGACYAAKAAANPKLFEDYLFLSEDMVTTAVSVRSYVDAKEQELIFVKTGMPWYEANNTYEFILDDTNEVEVMVRDDLKNNKKSYIMALDLNENRPNKTTRIRMNVRYLSTDRCAIKIRDLGFGDFYPATNRVWEKIIRVNE